MSPARWLPAPFNRCWVWARVRAAPTRRSPAEPGWPANTTLTGFGERLKRRPQSRNPEKTGEGKSEFKMSVGPICWAKLEPICWPYGCRPNWVLTWSANPCRRVGPEFSAGPAMLTGFVWSCRQRSSLPWPSWWAPAAGRTWLRTASTPRSSSIVRPGVITDQQVGDHQDEWVAGADGRAALGVWGWSTPATPSSRSACGSTPAAVPNPLCPSSPGCCWPGSNQHVFCLRETRMAEDVVVESELERVPVVAPRRSLPQVEHAGRPEGQPRVMLA